MIEIFKTITEFVKSGSSVNNVAVEEQ